MIVNVIDTDVPVVFCDDSVSGGVQLILVSLDFVTIVPDVVPHLYVMVCVKLLDFLVTVSVCAVPNVPFDAVSVLFLGMVVNTFDAVAVTVPLLTPLVKDADVDSTFEPSLL